MVLDGNTYGNKYYALGRLIIRPKLKGGFALIGSFVMQRFFSCDGLLVSLTFLQVFTGEQPLHTKHEDAGKILTVRVISGAVTLRLTKRFGRL